MAVHFSSEQMQQAARNHIRWWEGALDRPLMKVIIENAYDAPACSFPPLSQKNCNDFSLSPEQVIEGIDADLSRHEYLGDAFPMVNFDAFGPGVLAAFCGAKLDNSSGGVWFFPQKELPIEEIHAVYDPQNVYAMRIKDIYRAGLAKWQGNVMMSLPDLGGVMDTVATLRGTENLLMDLYDEPDEVIRLTAEVHQAWYEAYQDFMQVLAPQRYNTNWDGLLSDTPSYIIQCDFSYMISNPMFRQFVLETLRTDTQRLDRTIYHLDGIGELNHLQDLLEIPELNAVQWVFGDGKPDSNHWLDVYRRIMATGKQWQLCGTPQASLEVIRTLHGSPYASHILPASQSALAVELLEAR